MLICIVLLVVAAYALFFIYDWRTVNQKGNAGSMLVFGAGCLLVVLATVLLLVEQIPSCPWDALSFVFLLIAVVCAALMIRALFFSLPADTYTAPEQARHVYTRGMYALCRHPGVLWYCLMFISLAVMLRTGMGLIGCCVLCAGDVAYMIFQDAWSFPRTFCDYAAYKRNVPLIFPTCASIRAAFPMGGSEVDGRRA